MAALTDGQLRQDGVGRDERLIALAWLAGWIDEVFATTSVPHLQATAVSCFTRPGPHLPPALSCVRLTDEPRLTDLIRAGAPVLTRTRLRSSSRSWLAPASSPGLSRSRGSAGGADRAHAARAPALRQDQPTGERRPPESIVEDRVADSGGASEKAVQVVKKLQDVGVEGAGPFKSAIEVAEECLRTSGGDREAAVRRLIRVHVRVASANGAVTGLGGLLVLPVTLPVGLAGQYLVGARLAAGIAHLRGHDVYSEDVRTAVMLCMLGSAGTEVLKDVGITVGTKSVGAAVKRIPGKVLIEINKKVGYRLVTKAGTKGVINLTRMVPLAGAPIGALVEGTSCRAVGAYAKVVFEPLDQPGPLSVHKALGE